MPEGHTIHRLARDHMADLGRRPVDVSSPQGRLVETAALLDGRVLRRVEAYGKHLFYDFGAGDLLHVHLGLIGKFLRWPPPRPAPRPTARVRMANETVAIDLVGATLCALVTPARRNDVVARLGPDPLRRGADPERAWARFQTRRGTVGAALVDQSVIAGIGNVYRSEVLAVHGIHPEHPVAAVGREEFLSIWATLAGWLRQGVRDGIIITVDPREIGKPRSRIVKGEALHVYKQERCRGCGREVRRWDLAGRWAYACESCQPMPLPAGDSADPQPRPR